MAMVCHTGNGIHGAKQQERSNDHHRGNAVEAEIVPHNAALFPVNGIQGRGIVRKVDKNSDKKRTSGANLREVVIGGRPQQGEQGRVTNAGDSNITPRITEFREIRVYSGAQLRTDKRGSHKRESIAKSAVGDAVTEKSGERRDRGQSCGANAKYGSKNSRNDR